MATIDIAPDNEIEGLWWLTWVERAQIVARIQENENGLCHITQEGPFWGPLKSFEAYGSPKLALQQVRLYFAGRE